VRDRRPWQGRRRPSAGDTAPKATVEKDSSLDAWPTAEKAVKKLADDATLVSMGNSGGLALADVPDSFRHDEWSGHR